MTTATSRPTTEAGRHLVEGWTGPSNRDREELAFFVVDTERQAAAAERAAIRAEFHKRLLGLWSLTPDMVRLLLQQILDAREPQSPMPMTISVSGGPEIPWDPANPSKEVKELVADVVRRSLRPPREP